MQAINLSQVEPFDILLATTAQKESRLIKLGESIFSKRRAAFSHVAMFIAPTVLIESSDNGVVFE